MWWQSWTSGKTLSATWLQYTFTSSNLTCYHTEFVNTGQFFLPPLCKLSRWSTCKIPGVCRNSWSAPGSTGKPMGGEVRNYSSHHRDTFILQTDVLVEESCLSLSLCGHCPHSSTVARTAGPSSHWLRQREPGQCNAQTNNSLQAFSDKNSAWCY